MEMSTATRIEKVGGCRYIQPYQPLEKEMPTTLAIADDVFAAAQAIAERQHRPIADVLSDMARYGLQHAPLIEEINSIPVIISKPGSRPVTLDMVNALRDDEP